MGVLRNLYMGWKSLRLPWRRDRFQGLDLDGNMYFERFMPSSSRTRRHVVYRRNLTVSEYNDNIIPVQWQAWMRHTREQPPTTAELIQDIHRRERLAINVRKLAALESKADPVHRIASREQFQKAAPGESYQPEQWAPPAKAQK
ncbi:hypothetical protein GGI15_001242 [Coemansia interrupta]|uniref:NADH dehydrogenase [ubiquinone] 1 alpha subcomplex subunit n=1 Tax=Coemansia interrupta TaxID=1126814 RepID=A0A9W8HQL1_9FUNG|nr:hypothetical protein GGI15_001242 [Coemansia interrupta]